MGCFGLFFSFFFFIFLVNSLLFPWPIIFFWVQNQSGNTNHFTNFAILLGAIEDPERGDCSEEEVNYVLAWLSCAFIILAILIILICIVLIEYRVRKEANEMKKLLVPKMIENVQSL